MKKELVEDIYKIKKELDKSENNIDLYDEMLSLIELYTLLYNDNRFKCLEKKYKNLEKPLEKNCCSILSDVFKKYREDINLYKFLYNSLCPIINEYLYKNCNLTNKYKKFNKEDIEKLYRKYDMDFYKFYKDSSRIMIYDKDDIYEGLGVTYCCPSIKKSYSVSVDDFYTYSHELAHQYMFNLSLKNTYKDFDIEIYPYATELILNKLKEKNNTYLTDYLELLNYFIECGFLWTKHYNEQLKLIKTCNLLSCKKTFEFDNYELESLDKVIKYCIGMIGALKLNDIYFENKDKFRENIKKLDGNIKSLNDLRIIGLDIKNHEEIELVKKLIKN